MVLEADVVAQLKSLFPKHIGDDAAVLQFSEDQAYLFTKDLLVEDVHFRSTYFTPMQLAHKSLHSNLSDIAAMGGIPNFALLGVSIPKNQKEYGIEFLHHFAEKCKQSKLLLIGGDTTRSESCIFISVTLIGSAKKSNIKYRNTAYADDIICVIGNCGIAHLGLTALERKIKGFEKFTTSFLLPKAKTDEGIWLGNQKSVTAMMDISDGLFVDLTKLCTSSKLLGKLEINELLHNSGFTSACQTMNLDPVCTALSGGEDYGLLFTVKECEYDKLSTEFVQRFKYPITNIGRMCEGTGVVLLNEGKQIYPQINTFEHF